MKRSRASALLAIGLIVVGLLAACGGSSSGTGNTGTPEATSAATAAAKATPTGLPQFTEATCQGWMSVDEANSIMQPPAPATTIVADQGDDGGSCNYEVSKSNIPLVIYFLAWTGPVPIPDSDIQAALSQAAGTDITINSATPVTGIAQQAEYLEVSGAGGATMHIFYVLEGPYIFDCFTYSPLSAGFLATQAQLQQCATQVDSRL